MSNNWKKGVIAWMAQNTVASNLAMIVLIVGGLASFTMIKQEVFPAFDLDMITVRVPYPGASPEEVERGIVLAVEENVRGLDGVDTITSTASEGAGSVAIKVLEGADAQKLYQEIKQEVDRVTTFPDDAEEPVITMSTKKRDVMSLSIYGDVPDRVLREQSELLREKLLQHKSITLIELQGIRDYEIAVNINQATLEQYNLSLQQVATKIRTLALELPGGGIKTSQGEILVRVKDRKETGQEFAELPIISHNDGTVVRLKDIAEIVDGFEEKDSYGTYNSKPAISMDIYRVGKQTPIEVADAINDVLEEFKETLPPSIDVTVRKDKSKVFRQRAELLLKNGFIGLCLVMLVLGLFLEIRLAFWVMMGIPISFLGGMILMTLFDVSINMVSMFAFLISLGIVVDDAIVVGENVYEHRQRGQSLLEASINGAKEVCVPITFSILTNIVTFLPLMFIPGVIGKIWFVIPVVVCTVFTISLFESLFVLPSHLAHSGGKPRFFLNRWVHDGQQWFSDWFSSAVKKYYYPLLDSLLPRRYAVIAVGLALLILSVGYVASKRVGVVPMMKIEADFSVVQAALPYGADIKDTEKVGSILENAARKVMDQNGGDELVVGISSRYGGSFRGSSGSHVVEVRTYLTEPETRPVSTSEFTKKWRKAAGQIPGLEAILFESDRGGPGGGVSLSIQLSHSNNDILDKASSELAEMMEAYPIVSDIDDGFSPGKVQLDFKMRPEGLALGLTSNDVARQVRNAFYGATALKQQRGRNEIEVKVRYPKHERVSEADLDRMSIRTPAGVNVPLYDVAYVKRGRAYTKISREDGSRTVNVTANVTPPSESENILAEIMENDMPGLVEKYPGLGYGFSGKQEDLRDGFTALLFGFVGAIFAVYALLAIPFRSYTQPLIIMICIPFGIVGAIWAHVFMGYPLSMISMMGIVALAGVVVNDSLVLIDFANGERKKGRNAHDAVCNAGVRRFRPILLTTLTTFFGLAPMILETSRQARFMIPMAISLGYGILFATLITLILVPCLYMIIDDLQSLSKAVFRFGQTDMPEVVPESNNA